MLWKVGICEDDPTQSRNIGRMIERWGRERDQKLQICSYGSCEAFLTDWTERMDFALVVLDIHLGRGMDGMELARRIRQRDEEIEILFISGLSEYMSQGYDVQAIHFLVKPVEEGRLREVLDKALGTMKKKEAFLLVETEDEVWRIPEGRIVYGEAFSHTTALYLAPGNKAGAMECREVRMCLGELEERLSGSDFLRCHRSYLVHLPYVRRIERTEALLDYGGLVPVSRGKRAELCQAFLDYHRERRP